MKTTDVIRRAGRNLRQAKGRTILTSLAIGVGAFTIALAMAAGNGGRDYLDGVVGALGSMRNINVRAQQETQAQEDTKPKKVGEVSENQTGNFKLLAQDDITKLEQIAGVEAVLPVYSVEAISVSFDGGDEYEAAFQTQSDDSEIELSAGKLGENYEISKGQIVLPHIYLEPFGFEVADEALGKTIQASFAAADGLIFTREFIIAAVDTQPSSPLADYYDQFRISNKDGEEISELQRPADMPEGHFSVMVRAEEGANVDEVKGAILGAGEYEAQTFAEMRSSVSQMINIVQYGLMGFGALAVIASVFGIINTQYISVLERTQQIGLMKALGMRSRDVSRLFRYEAAWIGFLGGMIGVILAFLVTLLNPVITSLLTIEEGTRLLQMDWLMSAALVGGLMLIAIISGWFPSRKAARLDPIEALRTE